jgi:dTDP-4-amino-4,6-dideoxygalactose transaminase
MAVPLVDLSIQHAALARQLRDVFETALASGRFILGPGVEEFEAKLHTFNHTRHAIALSSGTDALLAALMALGIGPGDEVVTCPFTFFATAGSVARLGARPVFVDIDPVTFNINPAAIEAAITPRTRAIMPVHLFGQSAEMGPIMSLARRLNIPVIEDAAQAIGARDGDAVVGSIGDVGCLSFYPTKNLAALGDAGACVVNRLDLYEKLKAIRVHGQTAEYQHELIGGNFRLDALQASLLSVKIDHLNGWTTARRAVAARYRTLLAGTPLVLPVEAPGKYHVYNQFTVRVPDGKRDAFKRHLAAHGIGHRVYYPLPLHLQPCFAHLGGRPGQFPESERAALEVVSLPCFPEITEQQQQQVADVVREFYA